MGFFDLEEQFAFYGAYHSNAINIFIHMLFVWPLFFTGLMLFHFIPVFYLPSFGFLFAMIYALFYVSWDKKAGSLAALLCVLCWYGASSVSTLLGFSIAWKFIGHGIFEKRAPALLDSLAQAFLMGPFFVLLEALQTFFGYEPYPGFHAKVKAKVDANIKEWKESKQKKSS